MKRILYISLIIFSFGCEKVIHPTLEKPEEILVIDAWITQKPEKQEIKITRSQSYFENMPASKVSGADVKVKDLNTGEIFTFLEGDKTYYWNPVNKPFGQIGHRYKLSVSIQNETYEAYSDLGDVPPIDSIRFSYNPKDVIVPEPYFAAEFFARDLPGYGNTYWIKTWKNGQFLNRPSEINIAYDAGLSEGQPVDGEVFNKTIRKDLVNPLDEITNKKNYYLPPYVVEDSIYIEIHSIDPLAYDFLAAVILQTNRPGGFSELFATPLENVPTNIIRTSENTESKVAGFFNVSAVSSLGGKLTQEIADSLK